MVQNAWLLFLVALLLSFAAFPLVAAGRLVYRRLSRRYPDTPDLLWLWLATFFALLVAVFIGSFYLDRFVLPTPP